jgi:pyridoxal phosphate enzyme (YggS family)
MTPTTSRSRASFAASDPGRRDAGGEDMTTTTAGDRVAAYRAAREHVFARIAEASARADRDPADVTLLAVSKTVPAEALRDAVAAGLDRLGENRVQEAVAKAPDVPGAQWQLIGPLQGNKARRAIEVFASIQSVDSLALAERLDRLAGEVRPGARYPVLLQVNVDDDPAKAGFGPAALEGAIGRLGELANLEIRGLMTIGRLVDRPEAARPTFRQLCELSRAWREAGAAIGPELSMGMTDDFEIAIEEGATIVRVGRALFGERHHHGEGEEGHGHHHDGGEA